MTRRSDRERQDGYVAVMVALLAIVLFGMAAFTVDVGRWYVTAKQEQRAADAAALGGVPSLPGDPTGAYAIARKLAAANDFTHGEDTVKVETGLDGQPTRLRVTVTKTLDNVFGGLLGVPKTTITRSAVADYAGPVPLGSPCNEYGNDPEDTGQRSAKCSDTGQFWANVGSPAAPKGNGDAFQNNACGSFDGCTTSSGPNVDYDPNGYIYTITLTEPVSNLTIEAFDPALVDVGDLCTDDHKLAQASSLNPSTHSDPKAVVADPGTRYGAGPSNKFCTGDISYNSKNGGFSKQVATSYTVRDPGPNPWDPLSSPVRSDCVGARVYPGYSGDLSRMLDRSRPEFQTVTPGFGTGYVASVFRRWTTLCTIASAPAGTYMVQVKTNGLGVDTAGGHNRFALRAYSTSDPSAKDDISLSGYNKMAMYANLPDATTLFYLARVPSGAAGQILNVKLWDVGDSTNAGTIKVVAPADSGVDFTNCVGHGPSSGTLPSCQITAKSSTHNGKWQTISVPIPAGYTCDDTDGTKCWVRLSYAYGADNQPSDTTSWMASLEGDPVRLVE